MPSHIFWRRFLLKSQFASEAPGSMMHTSGICQALSLFLGLLLSSLCFWLFLFSLLWFHTKPRAHILSSLCPALHLCLYPPQLFLTQKFCLLHFGKAQPFSLVPLTSVWISLLERCWHPQSPSPGSQPLLWHGSCPVLACIPKM